MVVSSITMGSFGPGDGAHKAQPNAVILTVKYHSPTKMWAVRQYGSEDAQPTSIRWYRYRVDAVRHAEGIGNANTVIEIYNIDGLLRRKVSATPSRADNEVGRRRI